LGDRTSKNNLCLLRQPTFFLDSIHYEVVGKVFCVTVFFGYVFGFDVLALISLVPELPNWLARMSPV